MELSQQDTPSPKILVAEFYLGSCYEEGKGVAKDLFEAMQWDQKAAEQGHEDAKEAFERLKQGR